MVIKKASLRPNEFFFKIYLFTKFFSDLERKFVVLCRWISNRLSKTHFFCLEKLFQEECTFSEKNFNGSVFSIRIPAEHFQNFWEKWIFDGKISVRLSKLLSLLPDGIFGHFFPETNRMQKQFSNWNGTSLNFVENIRQIREKCITASRWFCWGEIYVVLEE